MLQRLEGVSITDSTNILFEGIIDDGSYVGSIDVPEGGEQVANLVVSGTTSGVTLKNFAIGPDVGELYMLCSRCYIRLASQEVQQRFGYGRASG